MGNLALGTNLHEETVECNGVTYDKEIIIYRSIEKCECGNDTFKIVEESGEWFSKPNKKGGNINRRYHVCSKCGESCGSCD